MSYVTVEVEINHGRIVSRGTDPLPAKGSGLLTILHSADVSGPTTKPLRQRVHLPLIQGDGKRLINPSPRELDASFWGD